MQRLMVAILTAAFLMLVGGHVIGAKNEESSKPQTVDEARFSGFLDDYSKLVPNPELVTDLLYAAPDGEEKAAQADSIMIDQPEIFIHPESKYKGMKPDDMKVLSDAFREIMVDELKDTFAIVEEKGPNVLYIRMGITGLYIKKKRSMNPLSYTPMGLVRGAIKKALTKDITKKLSLVEANLEVETLMSLTGERLGAAVIQRGLHKDKEKGQKEDRTSWEDVETLLQSGGKRLACRLKNARLPAEERVDCLELLATETDKK